MRRDIIIIIISSVVLAGLATAGAVFLSHFITLQCQRDKKKRRELGRYINTNSFFI